MKVTKRERYALRMMIDLATAAGESQAVGVRSIAVRQEIAPRYLEQIAADLRRAGLVASKQGQRGGYMLARPASDISIAEVVEAVSGPIALVDCLRSDDACRRKESCRSRRMWSLVESLVTSVLGQYQLDDLVQDRVPAAADALPFDLGGCPAQPTGPSPEEPDRA